MDNANKQQQKETCTGSTTGWTANDKKRLADVVLPLVETQKLYGKELNLTIVLRGWEARFSGYTIDQFIYAIDKYADKRDDFPTRANLLSILEPEEPKITQAEFIAAQKWQERNKDWSQYTPEAMLIKEYRKQNDDKKEVFEIGCEKVREIAGETFKRIG